MTHSAGPTRLATVAATLLLAAPVTAASGQRSTPPPAIAPDFRIVGDEALPKRCAPSLLAPRLAAALGAFNAGRGIAFTRRFTATGEFEPYNGRPAGSYIVRGRAAIASLIRKRHRAGDGWTAFELDAPVSAPGEGVFGLFLRVHVDGLAYERGVKLIVSCRMGLIRTWRGPAWAAPA